MSYIDWDQSYSVGVAKFDAEHKKLLRMINQLHDAIEAGRGDEMIAPLLDGLVDYVNTHFSHEEELMKKYNYSKYAWHKKIHDDFVDKVKRDIKLHERHLLSPIQLLNTLRNWLLNHICHDDKQYSDFFADK
ncbi:bacteriohemerythrin [Pectinatus frisingensis]|jgi:hemerythrin-like metal-binding protein|uniref:bacteriohemerythrin n=1 Tax=Pectinatus frisingensis TaxID=865 RepID=UPI0015F4A59E|nr:bacteriohemerythrin [Pectinatus frisingensis]